jgi:bifunctional aspartokinase / homoserine dehydrogenase 1
MALRVMKFGGTSVGSADAIRHTAEILIAAQRERPETPPIAVVSAMSGVTNLLLNTAAAAAAGRRQSGCELRQQLIDRHMSALNQLVDDRQVHDRVAATIEDLSERCVQLIDSVCVLRDLSPRARDWIVSFGERLSSQLVAATLNGRCAPSRAVDSDLFLVTDNRFGSAMPVMAESRTRVHQILSPMIADGITPIVTGFFGATIDGAVTTLGRGGSDFSATIIAALIGASEVVIWTDVDGVMTADPRLVPDARTLPEISFAEAAEMAYFGAKVIHPYTVQPALDSGIPIWIKNTFNPAGPGTRIGTDPSVNGSVKAISTIRGVSVVTVEGSGFLSVAGVTARVFGALGRAAYNVFMISQASSQHSLSFIVRSEDASAVLRDLECEFELDLQREQVLQISEDAGVAIVAVVGSGMRGTPGVAGRFFQTLGNEQINIVTIAQGSSELNISCAINEADVARAVPAVHHAFNLGREREKAL